MGKENMVLSARKKRTGSGCIFAFFQVLGEKCRRGDSLSGEVVSFKAK